MALLDDILTWSQDSLKPWQQDAARRLFQQTLTATALDDLYAMLKDGVGLTDLKQRKPEPLAKHHLPITAKPGDAVTLVSMRQVSNVNRLAANQTLRFAPKGLTVIYGGNGSGKSGYARVLKRACRSRDVSEDVRPNALEKLGSQGTPQAVFDIELDGKALTVSWQKGNPSPNELATVAVFDTLCARAYLDEQQEIAYLPFGLDIVENLAQVVLPKIVEKLNAELAATLTTTDAFKHLLGPTKVGELIAALSEKTKIVDVESLAQMSPEETASLAVLEKTLNESDPKAKAIAFKLAAARVTGLENKIIVATAWVKNEAIQKLVLMDTETEQAIAAEAAAATALRADEALLPGTGDPTWKALFHAARQFSAESAYPGHEFPHVHDGSQCVLCQQPLFPDASERLARFEDYIQANVAKVAAEKRNARSVALTKIQNAAIAIDVENSLIDELGHLDPEVMAEISAFDIAVKARRDWLLAAQQAHSWEGAPALPTDPCIRLKAIIEAQTIQEKNYEKATNDNQRLALQKQLAELKARAALAPHQQAVLDLIERMKTKTLLMKCKDDLRTKPISDKAKEFASKTVTIPLRTALKNEFEALGVSMTMPRLDESVAKGKMRHKLELDLEAAAEIRDILSEGEQRSIAIGAFLAELCTGGHDGGIIFDDPVSSLDHFRRQNVARRLVEEAKVRQVIIFTHDTSFLGELRDLIELSKIDHLIHHLEWDGAFAGKVTEGLPWHHQSFKERIDKLQQAQSKLSKNWPTYPNEAESASMRTQYSNLRATIERVIQDVIFNGVVVRYRDWIKVGNLGAVVGFSLPESDQIENLHKRCCDVVDAHDPSSGKNAPVPTASQLGQDIAFLVKVTDEIKDRQKMQKKANP